MVRLLVKNLDMGIVVRRLVLPASNGGKDFHIGMG